MKWKANYELPKEIDCQLSINIYLMFEKPTSFYVIYCSLANYIIGHMQVIKAYAQSGIPDRFSCGMMDMNYAFVFC